MHLTITQQRLNHSARLQQHAFQCNSNQLDRSARVLNIEGSSCIVMSILSQLPGQVSDLKAHLPCHTVQLIMNVASSLLETPATAAGLPEWPIFLNKMQCASCVWPQQ